ncbi:MAG: hypothetical protein AB1489_23815, partial [Acidobacteriota bacterium]
TIIQPGNGGIQFKPNDLSTLKSMFGIGNRPIHAYGCTHCGYLQLKVEFDKEDLERYQQFEGEQPSVLKRLGGNSENNE